MADTRNALAELAEVMDRPVDMASIHDRGLVVLNAQQFSAYQKAQRIVSELAKVKYPDYADVAGLRLIVMNCRAIAEKGAL